MNLTLCGKGIWLAHSYDLQRAIEMATGTEATHLMIKVGHGPIYFPETTRTMVQRVRTMGFKPIAWVQITDRAPQDTVKAVAEALTRGYEALVLYLGTALLTQNQVQPLAEAMDAAAVPVQRIYLSTPPLQHLPDRRVVDVLAPYCQGGWMPLTFATWGDTPEQAIDHNVYQALSDLSLIWGKTPDVYPVLSPMHQVQRQAFLPEEFIPWVESIIRHGVDFFSIYHAAATEKVLWPLLQSINIPCLETGDRMPAAEPEIESGGAAIPQPIYITVGASDTVWGIISRHGISKQQFWQWNAHLWDSRGLPRDPDYLQEGWRIRVK